jgi:cytochrome c-type biogenesis protein CcmE
MELTPREFSDEPGKGRPRRRRLLAMLVLVGVVGALGVIVFMALDEATTYFYSADEAVERQESLGDSRFRLQGMVLEGVEPTEDGVEFDVVNECVVVHVRHTGDPPQMFEPGESAVVEGHWDSSGDYVTSDRLFVAHDAEYKAEDEYAERIDEAEASGAYDLADCPDAEL